MAANEVAVKSKSTNWSNVYRISGFAFVDAFQFSFFVWSFWPFVQQLNPNLSPSFIGLIMAVSGVGEALSAPLLGYWANRIGRINPPLLASLCLSIVANTSYMCLNGLPLSVSSAALLISRFLSGAGSGNRGITLAYVASSSTTYDRTKAMALCGGGCLIGLTAGPSVQMAFTWIGSEGFDVAGLIKISMYTAPALLALIINFACIFFITTCLHDRLDDNCQEDTIISKYDEQDEHDVKTLQETLSQSFSMNNDDSIQKNSYEAKALTIRRQRRSASECSDSTNSDSTHSDNTSEAAISTSSSESASTFAPRMDILAVVICMTTRSARMLVTSNVESVGSPYSQLMFDFDERQVLEYNSMVQAAVGVLTMLMLIVYACTSFTRRVSERTNCIAAMIALLFFHLLTFSWPFLPGQIDCSKYGVAYEWCATLRPVNMYLYYISYVLVFGIFLPCLNNSLQSLYSLVLGNGRQGTMQGLNQAVGSLSRIIGPLVMSSTFAAFGPQATWIVEMGTLSLFLVIWAASYKRLVPSSQRKPQFAVVSEGINRKDTKVFIVDLDEDDSPLAKNECKELWERIDLEAHTEVFPGSTESKITK
ncbi:major facilitator superfamily domain-containing protein [Ditylenchus destructor]|uniref:Major facilitator superfamily domain-containing protein n=1 Tax=Ditylenchus destructor TaxID=166010 RepID=A0AAD4N136_9BILA|nr:major facilitator superfamily domain-containing protein [Ditylenchus destructor]